MQKAARTGHGAACRKVSWSRGQRLMPQSQGCKRLRVRTSHERVDKARLKSRPSAWRASPSLWFANPLTVLGPPSMSSSRSLHQLSSLLRHCCGQDTQALQRTQVTEPRSPKAPKMCTTGFPRHQKMPRIQLAAQGLQDLRSSRPHQETAEACNDMLGNCCSLKLNTLCNGPAHWCSLEPSPANSIH